MMKVERTGSAGRASDSKRTSRTARADKGAFARELDQAASVAPVSGATPAGGVAPVEGVDALWALQEIDDVSQNRAQARQRGNKLLEQLQELQHALLVGAIHPGSLESLAETARQKMSTVHDPRLREVLEEIELRAEVELAKWQFGRSDDSDRDS